LDIQALSLRVSKAPHLAPIALTTGLETQKHETHETGATRLLAPKTYPGADTAHGSPSPAQENRASEPVEGIETRSLQNESTGGDGLLCTLRLSPAF
jgi:hypothetical protein